MVYSDLSFWDWLRLLIGPRDPNPGEGPIHIHCDDDIRELWPAIREDFLAVQRQMGHRPGSSYAEQLMGHGDER